MPVLLHTSKDRSAAGWLRWAAIGSGASRDPARRIAGLPRLLEQAYDEVAAEWQRLGRDLAAQPDAILAHAPDCAGNVSDMGIMLAWSRLVGRWAEDPAATLIICDDPWLFRHLAGLSGVRAGTPPGLALPTVRLALRGLASRVLVSLRACRAALALGGLNRKEGGSWLLVYGHPASMAEGADAYFGPLMTEMPGLSRLLHVDCPPPRARALMAGGRSVSLHGWGSPLFALSLWLARWRPRARGGSPWLVRRAAALEGGTGTAAMIRWQVHCQRRFLARARPRAVAWPWENHGWEKDFVRACRCAGTATIGYQHATVGWREWNYAPTANPDGEASLPDRIFCVGAADRDRLIGYGVPPERLAVAGALRFPAGVAPAYDPAAPIFVALPFDGAVAGEMVAALRPLAAAGRRFLVKDHPMSPFAFTPEPGLERCTTPLARQKAVGGVLFCITTVGLEALLAGLPTLRFVAAARPTVDVSPDGHGLPTATAEELDEALARLTVPPAIARETVFAAPVAALWREALT